MLPEENKQYLEDQTIPLWQRILNLDASRWERSKYARGGGNAHRLKDISILRSMAPGMYEEAALEMEDYNKALSKHDGPKKYTLGRKLGVIPIIDIMAHPELAYDHSAVDKYFKEHPELRTKG